MGSRILAGRYELIEKIGEGGMAVVFKSRDKLLSRNVAIKILRPEYTKDENFIDSFRRESQIAANLVHPNIVNVYDVGKDGNIYYIVMELIDGKALSDIIREEAPLEPRRAATIAKQIASALSMAHKHQLIHRDVKPHNILMTSDGVAKITDFGIAKAVTQDTFVGDGKETIMGSVHYFSPEQARGSYVDEKSDIYSLGIVLYEMLTGQVPFDGDTAVAVAVKHINDPMVPPSQLNPEIPSDLEEIVLKATSKLQMNRYRSADEMITALNFVKFSKYADPQAAAKAAAEHGHLKDTLTEISDENYMRELKAAEAEGSDLDTEAAMLKRREKREEKEKEKEKRSIRKNVRPAREEPDDEDEDDDEEEDDYDDTNRFPRAGIVILTILLIGALVGADFVIGMLTDIKDEFVVEEYQAPALEGKSFVEAQTELAEMGLILKKDLDVTDEVYPAGTILSQAPAAGSTVKAGQEIRVTVSKGSALSTKTVPDYTEDSLSKATKNIEKDGYVLGDVTEEFSEEVEKGCVISQIPEYGELLAEGGIVSLVVSKGSETESENTVNLVGMSLEDAQYRLRDLGYEIGAVNSVVSASAARGIIISHNPGPDVELTEGQAIDLVVSMGPDTSLGIVKLMDLDAEPETPAEGDPAAQPGTEDGSEPSGEGTGAGDPTEGVIPGGESSSADPGTAGEGSAAGTEGTGEETTTPAASEPVYSVDISIDFSNASADTFNLIVLVNDGINTSSTTSLGARKKSTQPEVVTVSGSGSSGRVIVMYDNQLAYEYSVDFVNRTYTINYTGNNW